MRLEAGNIDLTLLTDTNDLNTELAINPLRETITKKHMELVLSKVDKWVKDAVLPKVTPKIRGEITARKLKNRGVVLQTCQVIHCNTVLQINYYARQRDNLLSSFSVNVELK